MAFHRPGSISQIVTNAGLPLPMSLSKFRVQRSLPLLVVLAFYFFFVVIWGPLVITFLIIWGMSLMS